jgi:glycosyltransferase involved in cell wall biosynthesis
MQQQRTKKRLIFTVINDTNYDQRMIRICSSLQNAGYDVLLVGRLSKKSKPLAQRDFKQRRLSCFFEKGKIYYIEFNLRLFLWLLFQPMDLVCAIDLDTILPCYFVSVLRRKKRVYDAHELFCEMKEVVTRPRIYSFWKKLERFSVPKFKYGYTVNQPIQQIFKDLYGTNYGVIMNVPGLAEMNEIAGCEPFILYQGSVNEGRSFETLIPAFQWIDLPFYIYGDGNFFDECKTLIEKYNLQNKVFLKGKLFPEELKAITKKALAGITIFENTGLSNYYSLGNRFFDYIHAEVPQVCVNYPAYKEINDQFKVAVLVDDLSPQTLAAAINKLIENHNLRAELKANCKQAKQVYNWQREEEKLVEFYERVFNSSFN